MCLKFGLLGEHKKRADNERCQARIYEKVEKVFQALKTESDKSLFHTGGLS